MTSQPTEHFIGVASVAADTGIPIGTIMAFAGGKDVEWLWQQGWLYCDGIMLPKVPPYIDLFRAIGSNFGGSPVTFNFNLPDMRGRFCRGVDAGAGRDPYVNERQRSAPGGLDKDEPGSVFGDRTSRATAARPLTSREHEGHVHPVPHGPKDANAYAMTGSAYGIWREEPADTSHSGGHTHSIGSGGDREARPLNKAVFFIIKYADTVKGGQ